MDITKVNHIIYDLGSINLSRLKKECTRRAKKYNEHWQVWIDPEDDKLYRRVLGIVDMRKFRIYRGWWIVKESDVWQVPESYKLVHSVRG